MHQLFAQHQGGIFYLTPLFISSNFQGYLMTAPVQWAASSHTILALVKKHKSAAYVLLKRRLGTTDDSVLVKCVSGGKVSMRNDSNLRNTTEKRISKKKFNGPRSDRRLVAMVVPISALALHLSNCRLLFCRGPQVSDSFCYFYCLYLVESA